MIKWLKSNAWVKDPEASRVGNLLLLKHRSWKDGDRRWHLKGQSEGEEPKHLSYYCNGAPSTRKLLLVLFFETIKAGKEYFPPPLGSFEFLPWTVSWNKSFPPQAAPGQCFLIATENKDNFLLIIHSSTGGHLDLFIINVLLRVCALTGCISLRVQLKVVLRWPPFFCQK